LIGWPAMRGVTMLAKVNNLAAQVRIGSPLLALVLVVLLIISPLEGSGIGL
jgi:hypothetical protein